jgi:hypothetical protein
MALAICDEDVAWCLSVGGAVAIAFAFARLAAIAAATLLFLPVLAVAAVGKVVAASGLGQAFSSCLRATESRDSRMTMPRSCHISSNTQKHTRELSLTAGLGSARAFFSDFSKIWRPPDDSMVFFERLPCTSRYFLICPTTNALAWTVFSWRVFQRSGKHMRG